VAFNVLVFLHVPSDNLGPHVHHHAPPKAFCQFNITRVTHQSGSVRQFDDRPSELIFFIFFTQVGLLYVLALVGLGPLSTSF
jgi:hypothetical protein